MKTIKLIALCLFAGMMMCACGDDSIDDIKGDNGNSTETGGGNDAGDDDSGDTTPVTEAVDLDLPSGTLWATCNVGASSPEKYGDYYAWGELETKDSYRSDNSLCYNVSAPNLRSQGIMDRKNNLTSAHDVATQKWGGSWRMPTLAEQEELLSNCTWESKVVKGINGCVVTGKNGNSIFLPAGGYRSGAELFNVGSAGYFWDSTAYEDSRASCCMYFFATGEHAGYHAWFDHPRCIGYNVRPVMK